MSRLPIKGAFQVTATYGQRGSYWKNGHQGIDLVAADRRIFSTCYGTVRLVAFDEGGWGQYVSIGDEVGRRHIFCHLEKGSVTVKAGEKVTPSTVLGRMGATGNVTGVHLHYQLQQGETVIDPTLLLGIPNRVGSYHSEDFTMDFKDASTIPDWAKEAVRTAKEKGWMLGDDMGTFRPFDPVTRAELAVILSRLGK